MYIQKILIKYILVRKSCRLYHELVQLYTIAHSMFDGNVTLEKTAPLDNCY